MSTKAEGVVLRRVNLRNGETRGDVIFVHGLDGDVVETWGSPDGRASWPALLAEEFPDLDVWCLGYAAASLAWRGQTMPLVDRATNVLALFTTENLGTRPIAFICHSLGGLLVKQIIRSSAGYCYDEWAALAKNVVGISFIATPHSGSGIASMAKYIKIILPTTTTKELEYNAPALRDLNQWFRGACNEHLPIRVQVLCEKRPTRGFMIVDESSSDPGVHGVIPIPLDEDHISISKAISAESLKHRLVSKFVTSAFAERAQRSSLAVSDPERAAERGRLQSYLKVFERWAFGCPCVFEGVVSDLRHALEDVSAAIATGSVVSRRGANLAKVPALSEFQSEEIRNALKGIRVILARTIDRIDELERLLAAELERLGDRPHRGGALRGIRHMEFQLADMTRAGSGPAFVKACFWAMDEIDALRNEVISIMNKLLVNYDLPIFAPISISSEHLMLSARSIEKYDWGRFYLREHETLLPYLLAPEEEPLERPER